MPPLYDPNADESYQAPAQTETAATNRLRAEDLSSRGIPAYEAPSGDVAEVQAEQQAPNTLGDKANLATDGQPIDDSEDAFAGIPDRVSAPAAPVPRGEWQTVPDSDGQGERDKNIKAQAALLGRKLTLDEHDLTQGAHNQKDLKKALLAQVPTLGDPKFDGADLPTVAKGIDQHFDAQYAASDANETAGWFGKELSPEAQARRTQIDQAKEAAHATAQTYYAKNEQLAGLHDSVAQNQQQERTYNDQLLAHAQGQLGPLDEHPAEKAPDRLYPPVEDWHRMLGEAPAAAPAAVTQAAQDGTIPPEAAAASVALAHDAADAQKKADALRDSNPTLADQFEGVAKGLLKSFGNGVAELVASPVGQATIGTYGLGPLGIAIAKANGTNPTEVASKAAALIRSGNPVMTKGVEESVGGKVGSFVGGVLPYAAAEVISGGAASPYVLGSLFFSSGYQHTYDDAKAHGASEAKAQGTGVVNGSINALLALPLRTVGKAYEAFFGDASPKIIQAAVEGAYERGGAKGLGEIIDHLKSYVESDTKPVMEGVAQDVRAQVAKALDSISTEIKKPISARVLEVAKHAASGAAIGGSVQAAQNLVAKTYDPNRGTFEGVAESAIGFGALSAASAGFAEAGKYRKAKQALDEIYKKGGPPDGTTLPAGPGGTPPPEPAAPKTAKPAEKTVAGSDKTVGGPENDGSNGRKDVQKRRGSGVQKGTFATEPIDASGTEAQPNNADASGAPAAPGAKPASEPVLTASEQAAAKRNVVEEGDSITVDKRSYRVGKTVDGRVEITPTEAGSKAQPLRIPEESVRRKVASGDWAHVKASPTVDTAAHEAATSPNNELAEPTQPQKEAGNYQKGHVAIGGLDVSIENPAGSKRHPDWPALKSHYGYVKGTVGAGKDHVDVFVKQGTTADYQGPVFVVNQHKPDGNFDEHKAVIGVATEAEARAEYLSNYEKGWKHGRDIVKFDNPQAFKEWATSKAAEKPAEKSVDRTRKPDMRSGSKPETAPKISPHDFTPALRTSDKVKWAGEKGQDHADIYKRNPNVMLADGEPEHGFMDSAGDFHTRQEAADKLGLAEPLTAQTLKKLQREPAESQSPTKKPEAGAVDAPAPTPKAEKPKASAPAEKAPLEPWKQRREDYAAKTREGKDTGEQWAEHRRATHEREVEMALAAGKDVPAEVLADYPALAPKKSKAIMLAHGAANAHRTTLINLGADVVEAPTSKGNQSGIEVGLVDGKPVIKLDRAKLDAQMEGKTEKEQSKIIRRQIEEEVTHIAVLAYEKKSPENAAQIVQWGAEKDELDRHMAEAYNGWEDLSDRQKGHEKARAVLQKRWTGKLTEAAYKFLKDFLRYMRGIYEKLSPTQRKIVDEAEALLKARPEATKAEPVKAEKAPVDPAKNRNGVYTAPAETSTFLFDKKKPNGSGANLQVLETKRGWIATGSYQTSTSGRSGPLTDNMPVYPSRETAKRAGLLELRDVMQRDNNRNDTSKVVQAQFAKALAWVDGELAKLPVTGTVPVSNGITALSGEQTAAPTGKISTLAPKLRKGQKQGDLLGGSEDLTLVGDKGIDGDAIAAQKTAAEKRAAEAKAIADRDQMELGGPKKKSKSKLDDSTKKEMNDAFEGLSAAPVSGAFDHPDFASQGRELLAGQTAEEKEIVSRKHWVALDGVTKDPIELFGDRATADGYMASTMASPGEELVQREPGQAERTVKKQPSNFRLEHQQATSHFRSTHGRDPTGLEQPQAVKEYGDFTKLRRQAKSAAKSAKVATSPAVVSDKSDKWQRWDDEANAAARQAFDKSYDDLTPAELRQLHEGRVKEEGQSLIPTLRRGEKQGDIFSKQTEDFSLAGETGIDWDARKAKTEAIEKAKAEAEKRAAEDQQFLFAAALRPVGLAGDSFPKYEKPTAGVDFKALIRATQEWRADVEKWGNAQPDKAIAFKDPKYPHRVVLVSPDPTHPEKKDWRATYFSDFHAQGHLHLEKGMVPTGHSVYKDKTEALVSASFMGEHSPETLFAAPSAQPDDQKSLPPEKLLAFVNLAKSLLAKGVDTPEQLAAEIDETIGERGRPYSQAIWDLMTAIQPNLRGVHPWKKIYAPVIKASTFRKPSPDGGFTDHPFIAEIMNQGGLISRTEGEKRLGERYQENAELWDDVPKLANGRHNKIYNPNGGQLPDGMLQALVEANQLPEDAKVSDMWAKIDQISQGSKRIEEQERNQSKGQKGEEKQRRSFEAEAFKGEPGDKSVNVSTLQIGDSVTIGGEPMKVTDIDPENYDVTIEDGKKFGVQQVDEHAVLYVEHIQKSDDTATGEDPFSIDDEKPVSFDNKEDGTRATVAKRKDGQYYVSLMDVDSGNILPSGFIIPDKAVAIAKAKELVSAHDGSGSDNLEPDRGNAGTDQPSGPSGVSTEPGPVGADGGLLDGSASAPDDAGSLGPLSADVPSSHHGVGSDQPVREPESGASQRPAGDVEPGGSVADHGSGVEVDTGTDAGTASNLVIAPHSGELESGSGQSGSDLAAIQKSAPALQPEQAGDVQFIESRLIGKGSTGVLITNGTGTGKTFTGLGAVKRMFDRGAKSILVVVPSDKIGGDWVDTAKNFFDIQDVRQLVDTKDNGKGNRLLVTTYANFGQNPALIEREWDAIVTDEAHYLSQNEDGRSTEALHALRALTWHPDGHRRRVEMLEPEATATTKAFWQDQRKLKGSLLPPNRQADLATATAAIDAARKRVEEQGKAIPSNKRPKVIFMSATPFAYRESTDYAEGYLFDYPPEPKSGAYNTPSARGRFMMDNFGYRMRYGKLTKPENMTATGILERRFAERLMREKAMSGRALVVPFDYSRDFVLTNNALGTKIDEILSVMHDHENHPHLHLLGKYIGLNDYLARRFLLEALKARDAVPRIKKHLALGRKVIVFHDYKVGGTGNPLRPVGIEGVEVSISDGPGKSRTVRLTDLFEELRAAVPDYDGVMAELDGLTSPIETLTKAFGADDLLKVFNGSVTKKERRAIVTAFNTSGGKTNVMLAQRASAKEGISLHDTDGKHQRVFIDLGLPARPTDAIQSEGRGYRVGVKSNFPIEYLITGSNWERWTFAQTIAQRASTAENLAMGEGARALLQSFAEGHNGAAELEPHAGQGVGGKEADEVRERGDPYDAAVALYYTNAKKTSRTKSAEGIDYFPTPEPLGYKMIEWTNIAPGEKFLEPSAGHGAIARFAPDATTRHAVEPSNELAGRLALNATDTEIHNIRFEDFNLVNKFDAIAMNSPWGVGGKTAIEHLMKAAKHLKEGGRLVALIPRGKMDERVEKFLAGEMEIETASKPILMTPFGPLHKGDTVTFSGLLHGATSYVAESMSGAHVNGVGRDHGQSINKVAITGIQPGPRTAMTKIANPLKLRAEVLLPSVTFKRAGTGVIGRVIVLDKTEQDVPPVVYRDMSGDDMGIEDFFERLKHVTIPDRTPKTVEEPEPEPAEEEAPAGGGGRTTDPNRDKQELSPAANMPKPENESDYVPKDFIHTTKGTPVFVAKTARFMTAQEFTAARNRAKTLGGYYSKFKGSGAIPGFHFSSAENRDKFIGEPNTNPLPNRDSVLPAQPERMSQRRVITEELSNLGPEEMLNAMKARGIPATRAQKVWDKARYKKPDDTTDYGDAFENAAGRDLDDWERNAPLSAAPIRALYKNEVEPVLKEIGMTVKESLVGLQHVLSPTAGVAMEAKDAVHQMLADRYQKAFETDRVLEAFRKMFDKMPRTGQVDFIDRIKTGTPQVTPELQLVADTMRRIDTESWAAARAAYSALGFKDAEIPLAWLDNHYRVLWKKIPGGDDKGEWIGRARRGLRGSRGQHRQHTFDTFSEGLDLGGEPYSYNPVEMFKLAQMDLWKLTSTLKTWKFGKDNGFVKYVRGAFPEAPDGMVALDDSIAKVYFKSDDSPGPAMVGQYFVEEGFGRLLNNYLSRDLIRETKLGRGLFWVKNATTALELSLSPFHAIFETLEVVGSNIGLGLQMLVNRGLLKGDLGAAAQGIMEMIKAPISPVTGFQLGQEIHKAAADPVTYFATPAGKKMLKSYPRAREMINDLFTGGYKPGVIEADWKNKSVRAFVDAMADIKAGTSDNYIGAGLRAFPAANEFMMKPLFDLYIPNLKVAQFFKEYAEAIEDNERKLKGGVLTRAALARSVWREVENRFGEMNFDTLFWNNTFKGAMQLMFRSVTWKLGSVSQFGGAFGEQAKEFADAFKERRAPELNRKMAWVFGMLLLTAALGTIISRTLGGKTPKDLTDMVFPQIDPKDDKVRVSLPTYFKDVVHAIHAPLNFVTSSMSGWIGRLVDLLRNKDYYGTQIRDTDAPYVKQALQVGKYAGATLLPFSIRGYKNLSNQEVGGLRKSLAAFGVNPAPRFISQTPLERAGEAYWKGHQTDAGVRPEQFEANMAKRRLVSQIKHNEAPDISGALAKGTLRPSEVPALYQRARLSSAESLVLHMPLYDAEKLYRKATPEEKVKLEPIMAKKRATSLARSGRTAFKGF